jgi:adenosine deaminase
MTNSVENDLHFFKNISKADVHNHLHLGGSKKKFLEKYPQSDIHFPTSYNGLPGMIDFIYGHLNRYLLTGKDVVNFMEIAVESSIDDNITLLEASVDANLARFFDNSIEQLIQEVHNLKTKYKSQINLKPEIGINKDLPIKTVYEYAEKCFDSKVFNGIDLYGKEANQNLIPFVELYKTAKKHQLKTKVHIGEFSDVKSIQETITILQPDELQHGINAIYDDKLLDEILERNIRLNICPESNIALGAVKNLKSHTIKKLFDKGVNVTVNTDDLILFHKTVSEQFFDLKNQGIFSIDELEIIRKNGFD